MSVDNILDSVLGVEHGFQHILDGADEILSAYSKEQCFEVALTLFEHGSLSSSNVSNNFIGQTGNRG
ncbi:hypothetical protein JCM15640A_04060 [Hoylesella timonensis 4401737 = DSM 22865 = JCM 15640]